MSDQPFQFPPEEYFQEQKVTPGEEPSKPRRRPARGKPILGKILFFLMIIALIVVGFISIQKTLVDLEAQAKIFAAQTATQSALMPPMTSIQGSTTQEAISTIEETPKATIDPDFVHTATISFLLTEVAP